MKKLILLFALISSACSAQVMGVKFNNPKTFILVPAITVVSDSLTISNFIDNGTSLTVNVAFFTIGGSPMDTKNMTLLLWEGAEYTANKDYTKQQLKVAIKNKLQQK